MVGRSLTASKIGIEQATVALADKAWTHEELAKQLDITRQPVSNFFRGKPVDRKIFVKLCDKLALNWEEITDPPISKPEPKLEEFKHTISKNTDFTEHEETENDLDALVQRVRKLYGDKIQHQCGKIKLLNISQLINLDTLYIDVYILKDIPSQRHPNILQFAEQFDPTADDFNRFYLGKVPDERVPGIDVIQDSCKVMVLGKPGSGKTTFLQYVAMECNRKRLQADRVPVFIRLLRFAEDIKDRDTLTLFDYIQQELISCGIDYPLVTETLLKHGKFLLLLDGLDEVPEAESKLVVKRIRQLCDKYYKNSIVITCRTNAQEYNFADQKFIDVEVADFNELQIYKFAEKWFSAVACNRKLAGEVNLEKLIEHLNIPTNNRIRALAVTPILLHLTCLYFRDNNGCFPKSRSELYEKGLNILLSEWDASRDIERRDTQGNEVYQKLSLEAKQDLFTHIAFTLFEQNNYFTKQEKLEKIIAEYFDLPKSEARNLIQLVEEQHGLLVERAQGIYSFSHLTFQEYFTAKSITNSAGSKTLKLLISHLNEKRWREIFLLVAEMLTDANNFLKLMKNQVDMLVFSSNMIQHLLSSLADKSIKIKTYKQSAIRAFYLKLIILPTSYIFTSENELVADFMQVNFELAKEIDNNVNPDINYELNIDRNLLFAIAHTSHRQVTYMNNQIVELYRRPEFHYKQAHEMYKTLIEIEKILLKSELKQAIQELKTQFLEAYNEKALVQELQIKEREIANIISGTEAAEESWLVNPTGNDPKKFMKWWKTEGLAWANKLREVTIFHRQIGHNCWFTNYQWKLLHQYYYANQLLVDCLNSASNVCPKVRYEIEETLLLPKNKIDQWNQNHQVKAT